MTADKTTEYERSVDLLGTAIRSLHSLDDDVEAHGLRHGSRHSDENLKPTMARVEEALGALRQLGRADDVEAHAFYSDENLKQTITQVEEALELLRGPGGAAGDEADVEAHVFRASSDENLKQAITSLQGALDKLKAVGAPR